MQSTSLTPGSATALLVVAQSLPLASAKPAESLFPAAWVRALLATKRPAALGTVIRLSGLDWFARSPHHVALAGDARAAVLDGSPAFALAALRAAVNPSAAHRRRDPIALRSRCAWILGRRVSHRPAAAASPAVALLSDLLVVWDGNKHQHDWKPTDYLRLCHLASLITVQFAPHSMLELFALPADAALWRTATAVGILHATQSFSRVGHSEPASAMARSVVSACDSPASEEPSWPLIALVLAPAAASLSQVCTDSFRGTIRKAFVDAVVSDHLAVDLARANAAQMGQACATFGAIPELIAVLHRHARMAVENESAKIASLLKFLLGVLNRTELAKRVLSPNDSLLAIDALALLGIRVSPIAPQPLLILLAESVSSHEPSLVRLATLTSVNVIEPAAPGLRCRSLLYVLVMALGLAAARRKHQPPGARVDRPDMQVEQIEQIDSELLEASDRLRNRASLSRPSSAYPTPSRDLEAALALDACTEIVSSGICSERVCDDAGMALWKDLLTWYPEGQATPQDLVRALDAVLSGSMSRSSALSCLRSLETAAGSWSDAERRKVAVVLVLRAALRCDLRLLGHALVIASRLVRSESAASIARDAVLNADAARKDAILSWYFADVIGAPRPEAKL